MDELENKKEVIRRELSDLAKKLGKTPSKKDYKGEEQMTYSFTQIIGIYGLWNDAIRDAGLDPTLTGKDRLITKTDLIDEFIMVSNEIGKIPSASIFNTKAKITKKPYAREFGSWTSAVEYITQNHSSSFNFNIDDVVDSKNEQHDISSENCINAEFEQTKPTNLNNYQESKRNFIEIEKNSNNFNTSQRKRGTVYGAPISFRGLTHEPINEQGVVFLFGMICKELGFIIEAIRTEFPDCEGKRCVDSKKNHWGRVKIEFEYRSKNFNEHGHNPEGCDVIVCWEDNWQGCPLEVIELKSIISNMTN